MLLAILHKSLVGSIAGAQKNFENFRCGMHIARKTAIKLRSLNFYIETELKSHFGRKGGKINMQKESAPHKDDFSGDDLEALEYTTYKLIEETIMLDKKLIKEYSKKMEKIDYLESLGTKSLESIIKKQTALLMHLEAKLPPKEKINKNLIKGELFTHWVSRALSLLSHIEDLHKIEAQNLKGLTHNRSFAKKLDLKISRIAKEKHKLVQILADKIDSMNSLEYEEKMKDALHQFTSTLSL